MPPIPLISILLPCRGAAPWLGIALKSLAADSETVRRIEVLFIDDGAAPEALATWEGFRHSSPFAHTVTVEAQRRGLSAALNLARMRARAAWLGRMDADDVCSADRWRLQLAEIESNPTLACLGGQVRFLDSSGNAMGTSAVPTQHAEVEASLLEGGWPVFHPAVVIRADAFDAIGGYNETLRTNQDHDLFLRLCPIGAVKNLADVVLGYRLHSHSATAAGGHGRETLQAIVERAWQQRGRAAPPMQEPPLFTHVNGASSPEDYLRRCLFLCRHLRGKAACLALLGRYLVRQPLTTGKLLLRRKPRD